MEMEIRLNEYVLLELIRATQHRQVVVLVMAALVSISVCLPIHHPFIHSVTGAGVGADDVPPVCCYNKCLQLYTTVATTES